MNRGVVTGSSVAASTMFFLALFRGPASVPPAASRALQTVRYVSASTVKQPRAEQKKSTLEDGPWKASQDRFAGWHKTECPSSSAKKRGGKDNLRSELWCIPECESVRALIAIVPDPAQTNLQLRFDRMIDGLQLAAESASYVIDHYWLPWEPPPTIEYADYASRKAAEQDRQEKQRQPGLLLFRWNGPRTKDKPETLFVFLVSDTATLGVNGRQFKNAVEYTKVICGSLTSCGQNLITIIGPTFSGSLASLRHLTKHYGEQFCAYSGTVLSASAALNQGLAVESPQTGPCASDAIPDTVQHHACGRAVPRQAGWAAVGDCENLHFFRLMHDTDSALVLLTNWLQELDPEIALGESTGGDRQEPPCRADLAIFSETGTTYGNAAQRLDKGKCYVVFVYPREISSLRNAYVGKESTAASNESGSNTGFSYLPFNLADRESNRSDEPPDFSKRQGPLSKEALLMSFTAELRRQHIKYAGIAGSNVLDVLFLASFLRKTSPDIRLFVLNADLLFEHDFDNSPFIGTLTLTTYPLILRNLDWLQGGESSSGGQQLPWPRLPFVDQFQQGEYNAALYAIAPSLPASCSGTTAMALREVYYPFEASCIPYVPGKSQAPLWLTAVGYGGHWPVMLLRPKLKGGNQHPRLTGADISAAWLAVAAMACLFSLLHILGLLANFWSKIGIDVFDLRGPDVDRRFLFINMASATLVTALGMIIVPLYEFSTKGLNVETFLTFGMALLAWHIVVLCILLGILQWLPHATRSKRTKALAGSASAWVLAGTAIFIWWKLHADDPSHYGFFFAYRSVHLATGVSPFTPLIPLLAGLYCWALFESWRLKFHDDVRPHVRLEDDKGTIDLPGGGIERTVASSVNDFLLRWKYLVALWLVFVLWCLSLHPLHPFQIFERRSYATLYECAFGLAVFLMLCSGFRLGQIWSDLKKLLAKLDQSRVKPAFDRVREPSWSPIWHSGVTERAWTNIDRCVELMKNVVGSRPKALPEAEEQVRLLEERVSEESKTEKQPSGETQKELQGLLQRAVIDLQRHWKENGPSSEEDSANNGKKGEMERHSGVDPIDGYIEKMKRLEEFVALRYVAFIGGVLYQIRLLIIIVAMLFTLILLSLNIYSFEPHQSVIWSFTAMFGVIGFLVVKVLREVHRDNVLSRMTGTTADEVGLDFYLRVALFGAAPLVTLLATHFPAIGRYLVSFVQPGLEAVK
jgi:hypothetical protein